MASNHKDTAKSYYKISDGTNAVKLSKGDKPYFIINGHEFHINTNASSKSEINLVKNKMYVAGKSWGYTDIQWTNFTGETLDLEIYSRVTDEYKGEEAQPKNGGNSNFYKKDEATGLGKTPHAVLKYWAQTFVICNVMTNIQAFEDGKYVIDELTQSAPDADFIVSKVTLLQYEPPEEIEQTYYNAKLSDTSDMSAQVKEIKELGTYKQECGCTADTPADQCKSSGNNGVAVIQKYLQQWGYFPSYTYSLGQIGINGRYCYYTTQAIKKFQENSGLEVTGEFNESTKNAFIKKLGGT